MSKGQYVASLSDLRMTDVALVGGAAEMASAFSGARKNRLDLSVGIALGSASQIALFVAPVLVLVSYVIGPTPMSLQFGPSAVVMMLIATMTASLVTNSGRSTWFVGVLLLMVYAVFAIDIVITSIAQQYVVTLTPEDLVGPIAALGLVVIGAPVEVVIRRTSR